MDAAVLRLMDANFNRAREALRVLEDAARFILNDAALSELAKRMRHDLCQALAGVPFSGALNHRDTPGDVGTAISTAAEQTRSDVVSVATAAGKRLSEALRCLEEYAKLESAAVAGQIEQIRYRGYELEKRVLLRLANSQRFAGVRLYVLLTEAYCKRPVLEVAQAVLAGGADCLQLREKGKSDAELLELAGQIARLCHEAGALFIMNDRPDLAVLAGADGVHLGQDDLSVGQARRVMAAHMVAGKSTHNQVEFQNAAQECPDYLAVGSIFGSPTKPQVACVGPEFIRQARSVWQGPLIAIGGVTADNARQAIQVGASGVAVCQAVIAQEDPRAAAAAIRAVLP